ncbi:hypothetical protein U8527_19985 [Kordia algicida OT-1]|uniref:Uncharacterized protein n=1 Tax=Kordia algicida OT-1 TaxID=391587 RepID=A9DKA6_9FLAO|nr:hypothetical protein [Kordia algicida]EDP98287.1 hypothetical protein KAOT1_13757 [Kordia algicida OT-1]
MKTIKIHTEDDISKITETENIRLEIYLKNAVIPIREMSGELYTRAIGCKFPNLTTVFGLASLDAHQAELPKLTEIQGNLNIHGNDIQLPELRKVLGDFKQHYPVELPKLKIITGKSNVLKSRIPEKWQRVLFQKDLDILEEGELYNLSIENCNVTLRNKVIYGNLKIVNAKLDCPNLETIYGNLTIEISDQFSPYVAKPSLNFEDIIQKKAASLFESPNLKLIHGNCEISTTKPINIDVEEVKNKILIEKGRTSFRKLQQSGELLVREKAKLICNTLVEINKRLVVGRDSKLTAQSLHKIGTHCDINSKIDVPALRFVGGEFTIRELQYLGYRKPENLYEFRSMQQIGKVDLNTYCKFPNLQEVKGVCGIRTLENITADVAPKLTQVGILAIREKTSRIKDRLPSLQYVDTMMYQENSEHLTINHFFHEVENRNTEFIISKESFSIWTNIRQDKLPIRKFISILKMRHISFDNFYTRELTREWNYKSNPSFDEIIRSIKKKWKKVTPLTYEEIFQLHDFSLRRFAFNYVGVDTFMKKLKAKRIATEGIEVHHAVYDEFGNKSMVQKHNIFEIYEADFNKVQHFRSWRGEKQLRYAVKCWCTSTNQEHWIWIESAYKDDPLAAIASTFRVHENVIPFIKCLKRQGDILLCEMKRNVRPEGTIRPLTKEEYFGLLISES